MYDSNSYICWSLLTHIRCCIWSVTLKPEFDLSKCIELDNGDLLCFTKAGKLVKLSVTPISFADAKEEDLQKLVQIVSKGSV